MDDVLDGGSPDSPSDSGVDAGADSSAGTQNTDQQQQQQQQDNVPFHTHPRWQQMVGKNRELTNTVQQLTARLQRLEATQQRRPNQSMTPEEAQQYNQAAEALVRIFEQNPRLKRLLDVSDNYDKLQVGMQGADRAVRAQERAHLTSAQKHITSLAEQHLNLPTDPAQKTRFISHLGRLVAGAAMQIENGNQRYAQGDFSVLDEAFNDVAESVLASMKKGTKTSQVAQTKQKVAKLPPAPRGGTAGDAAPEKPKAGEERAFMQGLHKKGLSMLRERFNATE